MTVTNLPKGWTTTSIGDVATYQNGRAFKPSEWDSKGLPIIRIQNLNDTNANYNFSHDHHEEKFKVKNGDLLFAWSASLGAYIWRGQEAWLNQHIFRVDHTNFIDRLFLFYALKNITAELYAKTHGSGMVHVTKEKFRETPLSLPPLSEQHRIVAKIEELFSELDKGIDSLKTARAQLNVYRQAVLKHAFEGKLTAQWREQNKDKLENPEQMLTRIKREREDRCKAALDDWERAVAEWRVSGEKGNKPAKPRRPRNFKPQYISNKNKPDRPQDWGCTHLGELNVVISDGPFGSNLKTSDYTESGVRVIRLENIGYGVFLGEKLSFISHEKFETIKKHSVFPGTIVLSSFVTGGIRSCIVPDSSSSHYGC